MDRQEQIRQRAHQIWEMEGCPDGQEGEHWRQAEEQLRNEDVLNDASLGHEERDVIAVPQGDITGSRQADGHVITDDEVALPICRMGHGRPLKNLSLNRQSMLASRPRENHEA